MASTRRKFELAEESDGLHKHGLSVFTTGLFIIGEMAGGGIVAMPGAMYNAGWYGVIIIVIAAICSGYTGIQLGDCWTLLQAIYPQYKKQCRKPYPSMGEKAVGMWCSYVVSACIWLTLFMASVAYLILCSDQVHQVIQSVNDSFSFCIIMIMLFCVMLPVTMLGTPADFWFVSIGAMGTSCISSVLIIAGSALDRNNVYYDNTTGMDVTHGPTVVPTGIVHHLEHNWVSFVGFAASYGTIVFAYGGHSAFPTMQHDMKTPRFFWKSVIGAYIVIFFLYFPVGVIGYYFYGDLLAPSAPNGNVTSLISTEGLRLTIAILIAAHVMFSMLIVINPVNQEIEELVRMPKGFNIYRVISRTIVFFLSLFVAESVPQFGVILNFVGSSTITMLTFVFPGLFNMLLRRQAQKLLGPRAHEDVNVPPIYTVTKEEHRIIDEEEINVKLQIAPWEYALNGIIIIVGLLAGVAGTYSAITGFIKGVKFDPPCYLLNR